MYIKCRSGPDEAAVNVGCAAATVANACQSCVSPWARGVSSRAPGADSAPLHDEGQWSAVIVVDKVAEIHELAKRSVPTSPSTPEYTTPRVHQESSGSDVAPTQVVLEVVAGALRLW